MVSFRVVLNQNGSLTCNDLRKKEFNKKIQFQNDSTHKICGTNTTQLQDLKKKMYENHNFGKNILL